MAILLIYTMKSYKNTIKIKISENYYTPDLVNNALFL